MSTSHTPMVIAAAREICRRHSEVCGIDDGDNWAVYGGDFLVDAAAVLDAAGVPQLVIALIGLLERGTDSPQHLAAEAAIAKATGEQP